MSESKSMFGLSQEDFDNIKKLKEMPQDKQDEIIDEALKQINEEVDNGLS